jgi:hypothetical protein
MRKLISTLLLLAPIAGYACSIAILSDPQCVRDQAACARRELRRQYDQADVVYEVTVQLVHKPWLDGARRSLNRVQVVHVWKTDGGHVEELEAGWGRGDCSIALTAGSRYVVFAFRTPSAWSFLPWTKDSLRAALLLTFDPEAFQSTSPSHGDFYTARTPQQLAKVLSELR